MFSTDVPERTVPPIAWEENKEIIVDQVRFDDKRPITITCNYQMNNETFLAMKPLRDEPKELGHDFEFLVNIRNKVNQILGIFETL